jgi:RNA polymerase sigma-70 factor (ECF subfamily)
MIFDELRPQLVALAYRMLGDAARAQDMAQEAWLRWQKNENTVENPRAWLLTVVTRLCLNELDAARNRLEEPRGDRLPEPVVLDEAGMSRLEAVEQVSMAMLVALERLTPAERAVLLLHEVFDFPHDEIAALLSRSPAACRKLLERARAGVADGKRLVSASREEHARLLSAFVRAASAGDAAQLVELLASDAQLITDGGRVGATSPAGLRNLPAPLVGGEHIAAFVATAAKRGGLDVEERELNGRPAVLFFRDAKPFAALLLAVADGKIQRVYFQADPERLRFLGHIGPTQ